MKKITLMVAITADVEDDASLTLPTLYIDLGEPHTIQIIDNERVVGVANGYDTGEVYLDEDE